MLNHFVQLEDDPQLLAILKTALNSVHPDVTIAQFGNSTDLLAYMQSPPSPVDMVMLDIRIVGAISGLEAAAKLRAMGYAGPMIVSSAYESPNRSTLTALGADYIAKPWRIETLLQRLFERPDAITVIMAPPKRPLINPVRAATPLEYVTFTPPLKRNLDHVARLVIQSLQVQGVVMLVTDAKNEDVQYFGVYPNVQRADDSFLTLAIQIMREGRPLLLSDATAYLCTPDTISFAGVPFLMKSVGLSGAMGIYDSGARTWTDTDLALLYRSLEIFSYMVKLGKTAAELTERNDELNAYTDTVAHDLKMPLSAIINYVEMIKLLFSANLSPDVSLYLGRISESADVMKDMMTHLLWVARLEHPIESASRVEMTDVVHAALHRLEELITTRGVKIRISPDLRPVLGIDIWMEEVIVNLISNAVKYIGEDNRSPIIRIRASQEGAVVRYEIEDNGIGIHLQDQEKLFQNFSRLHKVQVEGLGLGLVIVQRMITRLGGEIGVISHEGKGSCFWFTLPAPPPAQT